ncbi:MAG: hypothetical protein ACK559_27370, partial [bacterium]
MAEGPLLALAALAVVHRADGEALLQRLAVEPGVEGGGAALGGLEVVGVQEAEVHRAAGAVPGLRDDLGGVGRVVGRGQRHEGLLVGAVLPQQLTLVVLDEGVDAGGVGVLHLLRVVDGEVVVLHHEAALLGVDLGVDDAAELVPEVVVVQDEALPLGLVL